MKGNRIRRSADLSTFITRLVTFSVLLVTSAPGLSQDTSDRVLLLTGATIIDGMAENPLTDRSLLIEGNTVSAILPDGAAPPAGAEIIDLSGRYVIPGLIDSHVHWLPWMGELFLNHGVTTIVAMADIDPALRMRSHSDAGLPRIYHSGARIPFSAEDSPDRIRQLVREWLGKEPDMAHFPDHIEGSATAFAVAAEAVHREGFLIFGHAENAPQAIDDGMDSVEHVWGFTQAAMSRSETIRVLAPY